jgi:hypothetical protein
VDIHDGYNKPCYYFYYGYYECWDGEEWEVPNWHENDGGTLDQSWLTSKGTDGIAWTSPSVKVESYEKISHYDETSEESSLDQIPKVQNYYCGFDIVLQGNVWFECFDINDNMWKTCYNHYPHYYQCHDGQEWEHANWHENDGTVDYSLLTSVETDGILETSPSPIVRTFVTASSLDETSEEKSLDEAPKVQFYYCGTNI